MLSNIWLKALDPMLVYSALLLIMNMALCSTWMRGSWQRNKWSYSLWLAGVMGAFLVTGSLYGNWVGMVCYTGLTSIIGLALGGILPLLTPFGRVFIANKFVVGVPGLVWINGLVMSLSISPISQFIILACAAAIGILAYLIYIVNCVLYCSELTMRHPKRKHAEAITANFKTGLFRPKVSVHVPCYAEPPSIVIETLNALAALDYENLEVLVIDNNTRDESLWRPVEQHCIALGAKFKFFHVEKLSGAKAGALNFALRHTAIDAELLAVVDADYIVEPHFIDRWVPLFEDPKTGFAQAAQDYRHWQNSKFLSKFYLGYVVSHKVMFAAMNEFEAELIVGTVCLIRRDAVVEIGGWAEWCQTEDSELSLRLHAAGYLGYFFPTMNGRGLLPATFARIQRQMFRWSYGPIQYAKYHRRFILGMHSTQLSATQRFFEIKHALNYLPLLLGQFLALPVIIGAYAEAWYSNNYSVGYGSLVAGALMMAARFVELRVPLDSIGYPNWKDAAAFYLSGRALAPTQARAYLAGLFGIQIPWIKTDKSNPAPNFKSCVVSCGSHLAGLLFYLISLTVIFHSIKFWPLNYSGLLSVFVVKEVVETILVIWFAFLSETELKFAIAR